MTNCKNCKPGGPKTRKFILRGNTGPDGRGSPSSDSSRHDPCGAATAGSSCRMVVVPRLCEEAIADSGIGRRIMASSRAPGKRTHEHHRPFVVIRHEKVHFHLNYAMIWFSFFKERIIWLFFGPDDMARG